MRPLRLERCPEPALFRRGDADGSGSLGIGDAIFLLGYLFLGGRAPPCLDAADSGDSGALDLSDAVFVLELLFLGGREPLPPGPSTCGPDPTEDALACAEPPACP
ncbi:MAG: hypothetical protein HY721_30505 [Planctomycetes bacterium]|nr:hypothetical protein [Planctomycetota bacterium]